MTAEVIASFKQGDDVPPWLLDVEPDKSEPMARPTVTFGLDCHVIETASQYVLLADVNPAADGTSYIDVKGPGTFKLFAPGSDVVVPGSMTVFEGQTRRCSGSIS